MKKAFALLLTLVFLLVPTLTACKKGDKDGGTKAPKEIVKVSELTITDSDVRISHETGAKSVLLYPDSNGELKYKIDYAVKPLNATNKAVEFNYDKEIGYVSVDSDGTVVFDKAKMGTRGAVKIIVNAKDGSGISDTITIYAFNQ